tara:strand:+ start:302427 stop:303521 length:1095 start_codon:yes stop_codon:yes gene_type:complete
MKTFILTLVLIFSPCVFAEQSFSEFIDELKVEAAAKGITTETIDELFGENPEPNAFINGRYCPCTVDGSEPRRFPRRTNEKKFKDNQKLYLSATRLAKAKQLMQEHRILLERIEREYGVDKEAIVALWSIESYFGLNQGDHNIPHVLATLAWHPKEKRKAFFKRELWFAMRIYQEGHVSKENFKGSWAGAMGQVQFMPSTFFAYAVDGDGDGKIDIWSNEADAFASAANYLRILGWQQGKPWKADIVLNKPIIKGLFYDTGLSKQPIYKRDSKGRTVYKNGEPVVRKFAPFKLTLQKMKERGVPVPQGSSLTRKAYLYLPYGNQTAKKGFLLFNNFDVILNWNRSSYFAFGILSIMDELKNNPR